MLEFKLALPNGWVYYFKIKAFKAESDFLGSLQPRKSSVFSPRSHYKDGGSEILSVQNKVVKGQYRGAGHHPGVDG